MALRHHGRHPHHLVAAGARRQPRAAAHRAPRAARRHPRRRRSSRSLTDRWVYRFYRSQRSAAGDLRDRQRRRDVHLQRAHPLRDRHRRAALRGRRPLRDPRRRLQGDDRPRRGPRHPHLAGHHRRRDADHGAAALLVPAEDPHRQGDARLFRQRGSGAALRHQPRARGDDHLDPRGRARHHRRHPLRPRQVVPPLHLLPAPAADLRRGDRRRHRPAARRHRRRLPHRLLRGDGDLRLQGLPRLHPARVLAARRASCRCSAPTTSSPSPSSSWWWCCWSGRPASSGGA